MALGYREGSNTSMITTADYTNTGSFATTNSLTSTQGIVMKLDTSNPGQVVPASAVTDQLFGVLLDPGTGAGGTASIRLRNAAGTSIVQLGGTVAIDDPITVNSKGQGVHATASNTSQLIGYAMEAGTAGAIIEIKPAGNYGYLA